MRRYKNGGEKKEGAAELLTKWEAKKMEFETKLRLYIILPPSLFTLFI